MTFPGCRSMPYPMTSHSGVQVVHKLSLATVSGFAYRDKVLQMWWNMDAVGIVFCVALGCLSLLLPLHDTAALTTQRTEPSLAASLLVRSRKSQTRFLCCTSCCCPCMTQLLSPRSALISPWLPLC